MTHRRIQEKWKQGYLPGFDGIFFGDGTVVIANQYSLTDADGTVEYYWSPLCDTTLQSMEKYQKDIWVEIDIYQGAIDFDDQKFVFGDGAMGNEGYVASVDKKGDLNWAAFFTFSNPIYKAETNGLNLICHGDSGIKITFDLRCLTKVRIETPTRKF